MSLIDDVFFPSVVSLIKQAICPLQDAHLCAQCSFSPDALPVASSSQLAQTLVIRELQKKTE